MSLESLLTVPRHLLAATIERGRERYPVHVKHVGPRHIIVGPLPMALRERALLIINCPLSDTPWHVMAEAIGKNADSTVLTFVPIH